MRKIVQLKLKTRDFRVITRSLTPQTPPASCEELTRIALGLRERVAMEGVLFRLAGVGLSNFRNAEEETLQAELFT